MITFKTFTKYITLYHTYRLLYYKDDIQKTSNYNTIKVKTKNNNILQTKSLHSNTLYHTYPLFYYKDDIQKTSNYNTIKVKTKNNNILQTKSLHLKYL